MSNDFESYVFIIIAIIIAFSRIRLISVPTDKVYN